MSQYVVIVDMVVRPGAEEEVAGVFTGPFTAAISAQEGFRSVQLLKPTDDLSYLLVISFADRALQEKWVASDLHTEVWSAMEANFETYSVRLFHTV
jgi:heme-degrading monooxygenase HmoA